MFSFSNRLFSIAKSKYLLKVSVQGLLNEYNRINNGNNKLELQMLTLVTLTSQRNDRTFKAKTVNSFHSNSVERKKKDPAWVFTRTNLEASDDEHSAVFNIEFQKPQKKNKKAFLETIKIYRANVTNKSNHVDFIKSALKYMKIYGVERDLECYKKIIDILPKGIFVCTNVFMAEGMYFPRQQFVIIKLLNQMETHGVAPDVEIGDILNRIFGVRSHPYQKYARMLYWALKLKNKSPWLLPPELPSDSFLLAKLAIERITSVDIQTEVSVYETTLLEESIDKTWIVSGQSPKQKQLLSKHKKNVPVIVEGGDIVWLRDKSISYFVLKADGQPLPYIPPKNRDDISNLQNKFFNPNYTEEEDETPSVHEQDDGTIFAVCATGTSSKDSLLSWIRILQRNGNPILNDVPVLFRLEQKEKMPIPSTQAVTVKE